MKRVFVFLLVTFFSVTIFANGNSETGSATTSIDKVYNLKVAHIQTADHPIGKGSDEFAKLVEARTNGKVKIAVFPACQLGNEQELWDAVSLGSIDFALLGFGQGAKSYAPFKILDAPYIAKDRDHLMRIMNSDVVKEMCEGMDKACGVRTYGIFYYGARYLTTSNFEVREPKDLAGHTIRVPDQEMYVETLNAMGAVATPMAFSEVFLSLQQKVIDGQENPLATIATNHFDEVQKYLIKTEHIMGANAFYANSKNINELPVEYQKIIADTAKEVVGHINQAAFDDEDKYAIDLVKKGMILIDDVDKDAFINATKPLAKKLKLDESYLTKINAIK